MNKISKTDENRMLDTVNVVMGKCASGEDPSAAVASTALQQNLSTEQASRVCEAVNKLASISYLSTHSANRDADFPLADSDEVRKLMRDSLKVASEPMKFRKTDGEGLHTYTADEMHAKIASLPEGSKVPGIDPKWEYSAIWQEAQRHLGNIKLAADEARLEKIRMEERFCELARYMSGLPKEASEDAARYAIQHYGENGVKFLNALENLGVDPFDRVYRPYVKTGSEFEKRIDDFMEQTDRYLALKYAADFLNTGFADLANKEAAGGKGGGKGGGTPGPTVYPTGAFASNPNDAVAPIIDEIMRKKKHGGAQNVNINRDDPDWKATYNQYTKDLEDAQKANDAFADARYDQIMTNQFGSDWRTQQKERARHEKDEDRENELWKRQKERADFIRSGLTSGYTGTYNYFNSILENAVNSSKNTFQTALEGMAKANEIRQALQPPKLSGNEYSEPLSLKGKKYLDGLDLYDSFAKAYLSDPYLRQYPPEEVAEAFNIVHEVAPDLISNNTSPHVVSAMLRKYLANNNQIDPLEIKDLTQTELTRKDIEKRDLDIRAAKRNKPTAKTDK